MGDAPPSSLNKSPPSLPSQRSNLPMLYYGLVVVGTAALVLVVYNFIILKWCADRYPQQPGRRRRNQLMEVARVSGQSSQCMNQDNLCSFKYKKGSIGAQDKENDLECAVCLSAFEEGEEVRVLPSCSHTFHAPCIDMWLYSHSDCPLCRSQVGPPSACHPYLVVQSPSENSREGLLGLPA